MTDKQDWPKTEQRIDEIGQNGPTGEHYKLLTNKSLKDMLVSYFMSYPNHINITGFNGRFLQFPNGVVWYLSTKDGVCLAPVRIGNFPLVDNHESTVVAASSVLDEIFKRKHSKIHDACFVDVDSSAKRSHYYVEIKKGVWVDVYDVINGWKVTNPALQHLLKKALKVGKRGHKDTMTDCQEIIDSAIRAKEIEAENADLSVASPVQAK